MQIGKKATVLDWSILDDQEDTVTEFETPEPGTPSS